ncbi:PTS transporter subunit EIIB [Escherichia coli]
MSKNYAALAQSVVGALGGVDNITAVTHCMTRLRFVSKTKRRWIAPPLKASAA